MNQFAFLQREWSAVFDAAARADAAVHADPRTACFYARRASPAKLDAVLASLPHRAFRGEL